MKNNESAVIAQVLIDATKKGWRLFRNTVAQAFVGGQITEERTIPDRSGRPVYIIELINARRVRVGLCKGSSDTVGWRPLKITADMVGQTIAQFVAVECKTLAYGKITPEQQNFLDQLTEAGGAGFVARETADGYELTENSGNNR